MVYDLVILSIGFPGGASGKEPTYLCRRYDLDPWVGKTPFRREWKHTPVYLPGEFQGQRSLASYSPWGRRELDILSN